jgi:starch phosphorylase
MWSRFPGICPIISITNAQNFSYWSDPGLYSAAASAGDEDFDARKQQLKRQAFGRDSRRHSGRGR